MCLGSFLCVILVLVILVLLFKIRLMHKAAGEILEGIHRKLDTDTNTLITISGGGRHMRQMAADLNTQLRLLGMERRRLQSGGQELKTAVTNISHDLRTPLTAICGYLALLQREAKSDSVCRYLAVIENRTETMKQLTEELFQYSVVTSKADHGLCEDVPLNHVLMESISAYYAILKERKITPKISMPEKKILKKLDRRALSRIFENIIGNAVKYSDGDLDICLSEDGEIVFANDAAQLDEVQVGKLFDRFYTVKDAKNSTGIGLSIAKALTEQMNGTITAVYEEGRVSIHILF